jgi:putative transposase
LDDYESLSHSVWDCKYHVVFIPKYRKKTLYGELRRRLGEVFRTLAKQKESQVIEGHLMTDHVHMLISIPPKYSVAQVIGYIKGKSAIHVARTFFDQNRWAALLGTGVLRIDGRPRRGNDSGVHPQPRGRGHAPGAVETAVEHATFRWLPGRS